MTFLQLARLMSFSKGIQQNCVSVQGLGPTIFSKMAIVPLFVVPQGGHSSLLCTGVHPIFLGKDSCCDLILLGGGGFQ